MRRIRFPLLSRLLLEHSSAAEREHYRRARSRRSRSRIYRDPESYGDLGKISPSIQLFYRLGGKPGFRSISVIEKFKIQIPDCRKAVLNRVPPWTIGQRFRAEDGKRLRTSKPPQIKPPNLIIRIEDFHLEASIERFQPHPNLPSHRTCALI